MLNSEQVGSAIKFKARWTEKTTEINHFSNWW